MGHPKAYPTTLTIGGLPGTGTTTACRTLQERTGLRHVYAGQIFRDLAKERGMTLEQFSRHAEENDRVDRDLDAKQVDFLRGPPLILEGRLSAHLAEREGIRAFKAWFTCDPWVRAERVVRREGGEVEDRMAEMRRREESERKRYLEYYGIDLGDLGVHDLVLDTTQLAPDEVVRRVLEGYQAWLAPRPRRWYEFWRS